ncbi:MAG: MFS transporter [Pseudomonadota bacterium]
MNKEHDVVARNVPLVLGLAFFQTFMVIIPVAVPFFQSKGLDMQDVLTLQALFALVMVLFEVPSGYLADLLGRKVTLVLGSLCYGVGNSLLLVADGFWGLAAFEVCLALGASLVSGADLAMIYDSEVALGRRNRPENRNGRVIGQLMGMRNYSEGLASLCCSLALLWGLQFAAYAQAAVGWLPLVLAVLLVEPPGERLARGSALGDMFDVLRHVLSSDALLRQIFIALAFWSLSTFYSVWLVQKIWSDHGLGLVHFGYLWGALAVVAGVAGQSAHVLEERLGAVSLLGFLVVAPVLGYIGLAELGLVAGIVVTSLFFAARGVGLVILRNAFNERLPGRFRATANSLASFGFRFGYVLTGPILGWLLDIWGMHTALWLLAGVSLLLGVGLLVPLIWMLLRREPAAANCS